MPCRPSCARRLRGAVSQLSFLAPLSFVAASLLMHAAAPFAAPARAQVYAVFLKDPKSAKRYAGHVVEVNGQPAVVGEAKSGIKLENGRINYQGDKGTNELWVVDTADPEAVPYKLEGAAYVQSAKKGGTVTLTGSQIANIQYLLPKHSLYGLAREHAIRRAAATEAATRRDAFKAGSTEWSAAHVRYLGELRQLHTWLESTCFPEAAKKLAAEIDKQGKQVAKEARAQRLSAALASITLVPTSLRLVELGKKLAPNSTFKVQESTHLRFTYDDALGDEHVKALLELAEQMIDGFRGEFVDPWLGEDFLDTIPDTRFMEFWFGPEEKNAHEHFLTDWYGVSWGNHKEERIAAMSGRYRRNDVTEYLDYWKIADNKDFDAIVAHQLGHVLANLHMNQGRKGDLPNWIEEGVGYWLALSYLGKNGVTCKEFKQQEYAKSGGNQVERSVLLGETEQFTQIALDHGRPVDAMLLLSLSQMEDADLAKSWSFFEYVGAVEEKRGQLWLRALCDLYAEGNAGMASYRAKSEALFEVKGEDVFKLLDARWKARAEQVQRSGAPPKKK